MISYRNALGEIGDAKYHSHCTDSVDLDYLCQNEEDANIKHDIKCNRNALGKVFVTPPLSVLTLVLLSRNMKLPKAVDGGDFVSPLVVNNMLWWMGLCVPPHLLSLCNNIIYHWIKKNV